jgi:hypothetical protein
MKNITIDGITYIPESQAETPNKLGTKIVIVSDGWIFVGEQIEHDESFDSIVLVNASVVRRWSNGRGIGGLAKAEYKNEYELDPCNGAVTIPLGSVNALIDAEW